MATNTVRDLIHQVARLLQINAVGDQLADDEADEIFDMLNLMVGEWAAEGASTYYVKNELFNLPANTQSLTIGETGDLVTSRPVSIEYGFTRLTTGTQPIDYPLKWISNEQYQQLPQKNITTTYPQYAMYSPTLPNGTIFIFPVPTTALQLSISQRAVFTEFTSIDDIITVPTGYKAALKYNLALDVATQYGRDDLVSVGSVIWNKAQKALAAVMRVNRENDPALMSIDATVVPKGRYSIYSDSFFRRG